MMALWIYVYDLSNVQSERVAIFNSYLPKFMENTTVSAGISMLFCVTALVLSIISLKTSNRMIRATNVLIIVIGGIILCLNVFSMM